jgi:hypothetical protein
MTIGSYDERLIARMVKHAKLEAKATIVKFLDTKDETVGPGELWDALFYLEDELRVWCQAEQQQ